MPQKLIPISKKQHDAINGTLAAMKQHQTSLQTYCNAILAGVEEDLGTVNIEDAVCSKDGLYSLRLSTPDIAPPAQADVA